MPGSRLACAVRRRWPARAAEKGAGGVPPCPRFCFTPRCDAENVRKARSQTRDETKAQRQSRKRTGPDPDRGRGKHELKAPSVPLRCALVERGASYT